MDFNEYQKRALVTDAYVGESSEFRVTDLAFIAKILGLAGESGEVAEKFKKIIRNKKGEISDDDKKEIIKELGDVLWYTAVLAHYLGSDFETVAQVNLKKLADRNSRGVIKSKGDNR